MKKLVILGTALLSLSLVASEIQIKGGYDFNRNQVSTSDTVLDFGNGATAGAEYIFDNQGNSNGESEQNTNLIKNSKEMTLNGWDKYLCML